MSYYCIYLLIFILTQFGYPKYSQSYYIKINAKIDMKILKLIATIVSIFSQFKRL